MRIRVQVNVAEALRRGVNCRRGNVVDINPADLPEDVRALVAADLRDGSDGCDAELRYYLDDGVSGLPLLPTPDAAGIVEAARLVVRRRAEAAAQAEADIVAWLALADEEVVRLAALDPDWAARLPGSRYVRRADPRVAERLARLAPMIAERRAAAEAARAAAEAARAAEYAKRDAEKAERERAKAAAVAAYRAEMAAWIAAHGSKRLRRCLAEDIACGTVYRDERLAAERPGWQWSAAEAVEDEDAPIDDLPPRNPPDAAFAILDEARATAPDATLRYWVGPADEEVDDSDEDAETGDGRDREYVAVARFMDREIVFGKRLAV